MAALIKGTTYVVSFNSASLSNVTLTSVKVGRDDNNLETIPNEDGATDAKIYMDPFTTVSIEGVCKSAPSAVDKGSTLAFTPPGGTSTNYCVESYEAAYVAGATRISATLVLEDSMTYT